MDDVIRQSYKNKDKIQQSSMCGCYYCLSVYPSNEVFKWIDKNNDTALCPRCGIDSVLPNVTDVHSLKEMRNKLFSNK